MADEIKELIENADARSVSKIVLSDFTPLLEAGSNGNGHNGNGSKKNGHSNGNGYLNAPRAEASPLNSEIPSDIPNIQPPTGYEDGTD